MPSVRLLNFRSILMPINNNLVVAANRVTLYFESINSIRHAVPIEDCLQNLGDIEV